MMSLIDSELLRPASDILYILSRADSDILSVSLAFSVFCSMFAAISSIADDTSSAATAWELAPCDIIWEPELICWLAAAISTEPVIIAPTTYLSFSTI